MIKYSPFLFFVIGCQPQWVELEDATSETKTDSNESSPDENNDTDSNNVNDPPVDVEEQAPTEDDSDRTDDVNEEDVENEEVEDENEEDEEDENEEIEEETVSFIGIYNGTFFGANDGFFVEEFCSGDLELEVTTNLAVVGSTICDSSTRGTWTYSFDGIATEYSNELIISGDMIASNGYGSSFTTDLEGVAIIEDNNTVYMNLEWEFPNYAIIGGAELVHP